MAFYCPKRLCYVDSNTNKRLRGLWKNLAARTCPVYHPPPGFGKRTRHSGLQAGADLDEAVTALVNRQKAPLKRLPSWAVGMGRNIVKTLHRARIMQLRSQVVVHDKKRGLATAIDIIGKSTRSQKIWILELKYCGHRAANVRATYHKPSTVQPAMKRLRRPNSLYERHKLQLRETVRLYRQNTKTPIAQIEAGVIVACGCGSLLFYKL